MPHNAPTASFAEGIEPAKTKPTLDDSKHTRPGMFDCCSQGVFRRNFNTETSIKLAGHYTLEYGQQPTLSAPGLYYLLLLLEVFTIGIIPALERHQRNHSIALINETHSE